MKISMCIKKRLSWVPVQVYVSTFRGLKKKKKSISGCLSVGFWQQGQSPFHSNTLKCRAFKITLLRQRLIIHQAKRAHENSLLCCLFLSRLLYAYDWGSEQSGSQYLISLLAEVDRVFRKRLPSESLWQKKHVYACESLDYTPNQAHHNGL